MVETLKDTKGKAYLLAVLALFALLLALPSGAMAACGEAEEPACTTADHVGKMTKSVGDEFALVVPIVIVALGAIIGIAFAVRWAVRKFGGTR